MSKRCPKSRRRRRGRDGLIVLVACTLAACAGNIAPDPAGSGAATGGRSVGGAGGALPPLPPDPGATAACRTPSPGPSPLRRLSRAEYANTVADLFGDTSALSIGFVPEARVDGFDNNAQSRAVSNLL